MKIEWLLGPWRKQSVCLELRCYVGLHLSVRSAKVTLGAN